MYSYSNTDLQFADNQVFRFPHRIQHYSVSNLNEDQFRSDVPNKGISGLTTGIGSLFSLTLSRSWLSRGGLHERYKIDRLNS
ncbi:MAG: hypothetical protein GY820_46835 [Gammaproteobacteria bacterium]|nr:hypothetical protein [Gammaproteobacteria bacterium]